MVICWSHFLIRAFTDGGLKFYADKTRNDHILLFLQLEIVIERKGTGGVSQIRVCMDRSCMDGQNTTISHGSLREGTIMFLILKLFNQTSYVLDQCMVLGI